jgi:hypothetical protein
MRWKNRYGTCPEQLKSRLREFILNHKELPGPWNKGCLLYKHLTREFSTVAKAFKHYGLPYRERKGTTFKYTFPDQTLYSYNLNKVYDRGALYNMMVKKCDLLK